MKQRLDKDQKEALLQWVAEGLETGEINKRAAAFFPPFHVSRQQVDHYRKTRAADMEEITQAGELNALTTGLALREERVAILKEFAARNIAELRESMWVTRVKAINGEAAYEEQFNEPQYRQLLATLEQIADEVGDKKPEQIAVGEITVRFAKPEGQP